MGEPARYEERRSIAQAALLALNRTAEAERSTVRPVASPALDNAPALTLYRKRDLAGSLVPELGIALSAELIAILAVGVALGVPLWTAMRDLRRDIGSLRASVTKDIGDLRERMARLEGLFEGYSGARKPAPAS